MDEVIEPQVQTPEGRIKFLKELFLKNYEKCHGQGVAFSAKLSGIKYRMLNDWRSQDEEFNFEIESIKEIKIEKLEIAAWNGAMNGNANTQYFLLKGLRPQMYRDFYTGSVGGRGGVFIVPKELSMSEWKELFHKKEKENKPEQICEYARSSPEPQTESSEPAK